MDVFCRHNDTLGRYADLCRHSIADGAGQRLDQPAHVRRHDGTRLPQILVV